MNESRKQKIRKKLDKTLSLIDKIAKDDADISSQMNEALDKIIREIYNLKK